MSTRVLCIWLPNWPSQRIAAANLQVDPLNDTDRSDTSDAKRIASTTPNKPHDPIVLFTTDARRGRVVAAANSIARESGVTPAMPLTQVGTLCPTAQIYEHDPSGEIEELCTLAELLQCFSPIVGLEMLDAHGWAGRSLHQPQAILLDVTGIAPLFGGDESLAVAVHQWFAERKLLASIGMAETVGAAWALANYSHRDSIRAALVSIEKGMTQPKEHRFVAIAPFPSSARGLPSAPALPNECTHFGAFPVEALRLEHAVVAKLHRLGIRTLGPLMELPRNALTSRFGESLLLRIDQLTQGMQETIRSQKQKVALEHEIELEHSTSKRDVLQDLVAQATDHVCNALESIGHGAMRIVCRIEFERHTIAVDDQEFVTIPIAHVIQLSLFQPSRDPNHIRWLLLGQLDAAPPKINREILIRKLRIEATLSAPLRWHQDDLFDAEVLLHRNAVAKLVDSLSSRLGRSGVLAPGIVRDPLPERSFTLRPLTGIRRDGEKQDTKRKLAKQPKRDYAQQRDAGPSQQAYNARPSTLLRSPRPLEVTLDAAHKPAAILLGKESHTIMEAIGPERIESGWWAGATHRREYYRILLATGASWWIYRDLKTGAWYLHGEFD